MFKFFFLFFFFSLQGTLDAKYYENNEVLYTKGDTSFRSMYILVLGSVHIMQTSNEISKQGVLESKEVVVKEFKNGGILGSEEMMLNCPRQTTARCKGKTICFVLNELSWKRLWKGKHDGECVCACVCVCVCVCVSSIVWLSATSTLYHYIHCSNLTYLLTSIVTAGMRSLSLFFSSFYIHNTTTKPHSGGKHELASILISSSTYGGMSVLQKYMLLLTSQSLSITRRAELFKQVVDLGSHVVMVVEGECEVYQKKIRRRSEEEKVEEDRGRERGGGGERGGERHRRGRTSPQRKRRDMAMTGGATTTATTSSRVRPPSKFAIDEIVTVAAPTAGFNSVLGIVRSGFTFDQTTLRKFSFKARTNVKIILIPIMTYSQYVTTSTKMKMNQERATILQHIQDRYHHLIQLPGLSGSGSGSGGGGGGGGGGSQDTAASTMSAAAAAAASSSSTPLNAAAAAATTPTSPTMMMFKQPKAPPTPRLNWSRAAMRSDWRHSNILKDDCSVGGVGVGSIRSASPTTTAEEIGMHPRVTIGGTSTYERERNQVRDAGLREESSIVRALSPRLLMSVRARKRNKMKKNMKPIPNVGKTRCV